MDLKTACFMTLIVLAFPLSATAQTDHAAHHAQAVAVTPADAMTDGVIRKIDRKAGEVTIAHEALVNLGMPKMTMTFRLKTPTLIDGIKEGSKVRFVAENPNGVLTVVALQAVK